MIYIVRKIESEIALRYIVDRTRNEIGGGGGESLDAQGKSRDVSREGYDGQNPVVKHLKRMDGGGKNRGESKIARVK